MVVHPIGHVQIALTVDRQRGLRVANVVRRVDAGIACYPFPLGCATGHEYVVLRRIR